MNLFERWLTEERVGQLEGHRERRVALAVLAARQVAHIEIGGEGRPRAFACDVAGRYGTL